MSYFPSRFFLFVLHLLLYTKYILHYYIHCKREYEKIKYTKKRYLSFKYKSHGLFIPAAECVAHVINRHMERRSTRVSMENFMCCC